MKLTKSLINNIPVNIQGKYNNASIILLSGNLGTHLDWDYLESSYFNWNVEKKFKEHHKKLPNFQKELSKYTKTFSYTRPDEIIFNRYYGSHPPNKSFPLFFPDNKWLSFKGQSELLFLLLQHYKVEPPYIIIGFSKGGIYALAFANYYDKYIKNIILLDSQIHDLNTPDFKEELATIKDYKDGNDKHTHELLTQLHDPEIETQKTIHYKRTGEYKIINEKSKILNYFLQKHYYYITKYLYQVPWNFNKPIVLFQNIFTTGDVKTDINWSAKYQHKMRKYNDIMIYTFLDDIHALYITQKKFIISIISENIM